MPRQHRRGSMAHCQDDDPLYQEERRRCSDKITTSGTTTSETTSRPSVVAGCADGAGAHVYACLLGSNQFTPQCCRQCNCPKSPEHQGGNAEVRCQEPDASHHAVVSSGAGAASSSTGPATTSSSSSSSTTAAAPMHDVDSHSAPVFERTRLARLQAAGPEFGDIILVHRKVLKMEERVEGPDLSADDLYRRYRDSIEDRVLRNKAKRADIALNHFRVTHSTTVCCYAA